MRRKTLESFKMEEHFAVDKDENINPLGYNLSTTRTFRRKYFKGNKHKFSFEICKDICSWALLIPQAYSFPRAPFSQTVGT